MYKNISYYKKYVKSMYRIDIKFSINNGDNITREFFTINYLYVSFRINDKSIM